MFPFTRGPFRIRIFDPQPHGTQRGDSSAGFVGLHVHLQGSTLVPCPFQRETSRMLLLWKRQWFKCLNKLGPTILVEPAFFATDPHVHKGSRGIPEIPFEVSFSRLWGLEKWMWGTQLWSPYK